MAENDAEETKGKSGRQLTARLLEKSQNFGQMQENLPRNKDIRPF